MQESILKKGVKYLANTYSRFPIVATKGEGCWIWDLNGRRYLDFLSGIAVCNLGHAHPKVAEAVSAQAHKLFHISNLFYTEIQIKAAELLVEQTFADKVFFCNSGAEANEAAIKLARRYAWKKRGEGCHEIIVMENSFHGRTMAALTATGQPKFHVGFAPLLGGFTYVPFNNLEAVMGQISERTCAVMLELIQGEGGVNVADKAYVEDLRRVAREKEILLILDEVQTGMGRTGKFFSYEHFDIEPDILTVAKGLGNGFPVGAMIAREEVMNAFEPGTHASTFGGNPLAAAAVVATLETFADEGVLKQCAETGQYLKKGLLALKAKFPFITDVRGMGLIWGIEVSVNGDKLLQEFLKEGVLLLCSKGSILRLLPPLVIGREEVDIFLEITERIFERQGKA